MGILNRYPYFSVFIIILLGNWDWLAESTDGRARAILLGMFTANICHIIFVFFADIVLDGVDAMVICFAIDKQNGLKAAEYADNKDEIVATMYVILDDMVKKESDEAAGDTPVAMGTAIPTPPQNVGSGMIQLTVPEGVKP